MGRIFTELVLEERELEKEVAGCVYDETRLKYGIKRYDISVETDSAAKTLRKKIGRYITIEAQAVLERRLEVNTYVAKQLCDAVNCLMRPLNLPKERVVLCAGIGNRSMTADALGPEVMKNIIVTRHFLNLQQERFDTRLNSVCAAAPGVLGETGIESFDIIKGIADKVKPDLIIAVDSLSARRTERISTTFQLSDTGLTPGGGLDNPRSAVNKETLNIPVIAIGVPFVVHAKTLSMDVIEELFRRLPSYSAPNEYQINHTLRGTVSDVLGDLVVTPKEINQIMKDCSFIISLGLNLALHPKLSADDVLNYIH